MIQNAKKPQVKSLRFLLNGLMGLKIPLKFFVHMNEKSERDAEARQKYEQVALVAGAPEQLPDTYP